MPAALRCALAATIAVGAYADDLDICGWVPEPHWPQMGIQVEGLDAKLDGYYAQWQAIQWNKGGLKNRPELVMNRFDENTEHIDISSADYEKYYKKWVVINGSRACVQHGCTVYAVCTAGCPNMKDQASGDLHNSAVFPKKGANDTTWRVLQTNKEVRGVTMTCAKPAPLPPCTKTCSQAACASIDIQVCSDEYQTPCCEVKTPAFMPPECVCRNQTQA
eukprot:Hpha_TRINITY_DN14600_c0_g2::TRINITY_DN14600_c0_g2_i1::g.47766::m.47766